MEVTGVLLRRSPVSSLVPSHTIQLHQQWTVQSWVPRASKSCTSVSAGRLVVEAKKKPKAQQKRKDKTKAKATTKAADLTETHEVEEITRLSELKKVHKQPLGTVAQSSIAEVARNSKEQVANMGDGRNEEVIHDMRVALRRLRSAVDGFKPILDLPEEARRPAITKVLKTLGALRDADVMQEVLADAEKDAGSVGDEEKAAIEKVLAAMGARREEAITLVAKTLKSNSTKQLLKATEDWLTRPRFLKGKAGLVARSTGSVAPALLTPRVSAVLLHPAWAINEIRLREVSDAPSIEHKDGVPPIAHLDSKDCATMHDLRKKMRELRYMMELLAPAYKHSKHFKKQLQHLVKMQSLLGTLQDLEVLTQFLAAQLGPRFDSQLPQLTHAMALEHKKTWENWLVIREDYLSTQGRAALYEAMLYPDESDSGVDSDALEGLEESGAALVSASDKAGPASENGGVKEERVGASAQQQ